MSISGAIVLYAVIWFLALLVALPIGIRSQEEAGRIVPGTPASAPENPRIRLKMIWVTVSTTLIWGAICATLIWGGLSVRDIDFFGRM